MPPENNQQPIVVNPGHQTLWGILAYLGILIVIPFLVSKDDPFVKFHIKQGLVLFCIGIVVWILHSSFMGALGLIFSIINLAIFVLCIIGIVNVVQHKEKELPLVGHLSSLFKF